MPITVDAAEAGCEPEVGQSCTISRRGFREIREPLFELIAQACSNEDAEGTLALISTLAGKPLDRSLEPCRSRLRSALAGLSWEGTRKVVLHVFRKLPIGVEATAELVFNVKALLHGARLPIAFVEDGRFVAMPAANKPFSARYLSPAATDVDPDLWAPRAVRDVYDSLKHADFDAIDADYHGDAFAAGLLGFAKSYLAGPAWDASNAVSATPWYRVYDGLERVYWAWSSSWIASQQVEHFCNKRLRECDVPLIMVDGRVQPLAKEGTPFRLVEQPVARAFRSGQG